MPAGEAARMLRCVHVRILVIALLVVVLACGKDAPGDSAAPVKNEAQAAAFLHHTHIVPVHAVGQERGVHYYAMQLIDGRSLAQIVEELRHGKAKPSQPLSVITKGKSTQNAESHLILLSFLIVMAIASLGSQSFYPRQGMMFLWCVLGITMRDVSRTNDAQKPPSEIH